MDKTKMRGFTLIELLVVIAIIGILSSVVLASLSIARAKSRDARRVSDVEQIRTALELYFDSYSTYPTSSATTLQSWTNVAGSFSQAGGIVNLPSATVDTIKLVPLPPVAGYLYYYCPRTSAASANCDGTSAATFYSLGADMERKDGSSLLADADRTITGTFFGLGSTCTTNDSGNERCFDVNP